MGTAGSGLGERDERFLRRAIALARNGVGKTSPNPAVGAVVARGDRVLGEGWHRRAGEPHAEREALAACTADPRGATLYVSLEPCCHHGRTPPCTDAIVAAGIRRVVVASDDPSDKASGRGLAVLRDEGIEIVVAGGDLAREARLLNQPFRKHARSGRPHVVLKYAMTLDGAVATRSGDSRWISSERSRELVHRWRAAADAVAVGIGTALADDPLLTARLPDVERQPLRIVFDSEARLPPTGTLARTVAEAPVLVFASRAAPRPALERLEAAGVEVVVVGGPTAEARVANALDELGQRGVQSLLLEGGPRLAAAFLAAGEVDELRVFVAPILVADRDAPRPLAGSGPEAIADALRAQVESVERIDDDVLIHARLREW